MQKALDLLRFIRSHTERIILFVASVVALWIWIRAESWEKFAATVISVLALWFSYQARCYSREKFRLELFEKRLEFYGIMVDLCSMVLHGFIESEDADQREEVNRARDYSIRGSGLHKAHLLFGDDIVQKVRELDQAFTTLSMARTARQSSANFEAQEKMRAFSLFQQTVDSMPVLFRPYIYFGDYQQR